MKKDMRTIIIIPTNGKCQAPGIAVNVKDDKNAYANAIIEAKNRSRLSDFNNWIFV